MKKTVITFGLISGLIIVVLGYATTSLATDANGRLDFSKGEIFGYINMLIALSMIFFGIRQYRERYLDGRITFGQAFKVGILISLIASVIYVLGWMVYYNTSDLGETFPAQYLDHMKEKWAAAGMSADQINQKAQGFEKNMEMFKNPLIMAGMTLMEIFPIGLVITLISAFILKRK